jgi:rhodanese-related sulfurtransferase
MRIKKGRIEEVITVLLITALLLTSICCNTSTASTQILMNITAEESFDLIQDNLDNPDFVILDVRTEDEYAEGHIENSVNIDYYTNDFEQTIGELDKNKTYLVYCRSGNRSASVMNIMKQQGFKEVYNMLGGISVWESAGYPTIK